jgi:hypothetical protein
MSKRILVLFGILVFPILLISQVVNFDTFFIDKTMRIDYYHFGDAKEEFVTIDQIYQQGRWAGNPKHLVDSFNNGRYTIKIYDRDSNKLIYSRGFDSYFGEYQTTDPALEGKKRVYHETALIPYPKKPIFFALEARDKKNLLHGIFVQEIDPDDYHIITENLSEGDLVYESAVHGDPHNKVDVVLVGDGFKADQWEDFKSVVDRYTEEFFKLEPYTSYKEKFNIYGVLRPSADSGIDEPRKRIYKNTPISTSFNALDLSRYVLTEDNKTLRDIAGRVPYDAVIILVNHDRYGGGGIYNFYAVTTVNNDLSVNVFHHEFGHSFTGLADEYYSSAVAYNDFYPKGVEPTEPNITALLDPENIKWKDSLTQGIEVPTEWGKAEHDGMYQEMRDLRRDKASAVQALKEKDASENKIKKTEEKYDKQIDALRQKAKDFILNHPLKDVVGVFEGAGYSSEGLYRPMLDCIMISNRQKHFCKVCEAAIIRMINYYSN